MRIAVLSIAMLLVAATIPPATGAETKKTSESVPGTTVEMPYLIAPLTSGDTLYGYAYVSTAIIASSPSAAIDIRGRIAFIQDAFVRDVNNGTIAKPDDVKSVDSAVLTARLLADVKKVMKPGKVTGLKVIEIQIRPMRPEAVPPGSPS